METKEVSKLAGKVAELISNDIKNYFLSAIDDMHKIKATVTDKRELLKTGMEVVVRWGGVFIVYKDTQEGDILVQKNGEIVMELGMYDNDLTVYQNRDIDIIKIYGIKSAFDLVTKKSEDNLIFERNDQEKAPYKTSLKQEGLLRDFAIMAEVSRNVKITELELKNILERFSEVKNNEN